MGMYMLLFSYIWIFAVEVSSAPEEKSLLAEVYKDETDSQHRFATPVVSTEGALSNIRDPLQEQRAASCENSPSNSESAVMSRLFGRLSKDGYRLQQQEQHGSFSSFLNASGRGMSMSYSVASGDPDEEGRKQVRSMSVA
jgi:hypothetical protein